MKNVVINNRSNKPIYQQLYDQISSQILLKQLPEETKLPSIRNTAKELRVSVITIKKTWEMLEQNHYIYTVAGKGSYVSVNTDKALKNRKSDLIEASLTEVIDQSKNLGIEKSELITLIEKLYK